MSHADDDDGDTSVFWSEPVLEARSELTVNFENLVIRQRDHILRGNERAHGPLYPKRWPIVTSNPPQIRTMMIHLSLSSGSHAHFPLLTEIRQRPRIFFEPCFVCSS